MVEVKVVFLMKGAKRTKRRERTQKIVVGSQAWNEVRSFFQLDRDPKVRYNRPTPTKTEPLLAWITWEDDSLAYI